MGKGIDLSRSHCLPKADHHYVEPGNLYLLRDNVGIETYDYLYSYNFINETKYFRILLYEWFLVVKEGGYIIIEFEDNEIMDYSRLKSEITTLVLYKDKYKIVEECSEGNRKKIILQKTASIKRPDNEINQWTFGMVTNGKRKDFIEKAIKSIRGLNVPQYEIILCGTYYGEIKNDINYIHFTEHDDKGWITKKKNLICENASYENIVVIHDRIYFDREWFIGMKNYENYFDVLSCPVILFLKNGKTITSNWETLKEGFKLEDDKKLFHTNGALDFSDWDKNAIIPGPLIILKKHIWSLEKWNENLFWGEAEDIEYSHRQHRSGIMIRLNSYSKVYASSISGIAYKAYYEKNTKKLGKFHCELPALVIFILKMLDLLGPRRNQRIVQYFIRQVKKLYNASSWKDLKAKK